jgi:deoxyguanosine kinase
MEKGNFFAIDGCIGVGKTTITKFISEKFGMETMFEIVEENPFLEKFYNDPKHWAFQTETFFLCNRYKQLQEVMKSIQSGKNLVSDYHISKNLIFASLNLSEEENKKYKKLFNVFIEGFTHPNIIIYSEASLEEILRRIKLRGRIIEKGIDPNYLSDLINSYKKVMNFKNLEKRYPGVQMIKINANKVDFVENPERLECLYNAVCKAMTDRELKYQEIN